MNILAPNSPKRLQYVDILRGGAIVLVVIGHILEQNVYSSSSLHDFIYSFHMPLFMYISGYCIQMSLRCSNITFSYLCYYIIKKARVLMLPYCVWNLIIYPYLGIGSYCLTTLVYRTFIDSTELWFLPTLFVLSSTYIINEFVKTKAHVYGYLADVILILIWLTIFYVFSVILDSSLLRSIITFMIPLYIGVWMRRYPKIEDTLKSNDFLSVVGLLLYFLYGSLISNISGSHTYIYMIHRFSRLLTGLLLLPLFWKLSVSLAESSSRIGRTLADVGKRTLPIYIIHYLFIKNLSLFNYNMPLIEQIVLSGIYCTVIIFVIRLFEWTIKRNRILSLVLFGK